MNTLLPKACHPRRGKKETRLQALEGVQWIVPDREMLLLPRESEDNEINNQHLHDIDLCSVDLQCVPKV